MTKIAYYYHKNKELINVLKKYNPVIIIDDIKLVDELLEYNLHIKNIKYEEELYDVIISDKDDFKNLSSIKRVAIGEFKKQKPKITYLTEFNEEIFKDIDHRKYKFSIIVPNFNNEEWISKTIESVLDQTYDNWEMYIIDDMSTDNSIEVIEKYKDERIKLSKNLIKLYNGGSRNIGILKAKESNYDGYLLFIDSDDWLADNKVLENLNRYIDGEDLITLDYYYYMGNERKRIGKHSYRTKDELFMTIGSMCAVWCKCIKTRIAPLFEFNTLMEDRNYHYRVVNKAKTWSNFGRPTHVWNKMNTKSITTNKRQKYDSTLQAKIEWDNCAYRHIAGMLDLLNELDNTDYIKFIKDRIKICEEKVSNKIYEQY